MSRLPISARSDVSEAEKKLRLLDRRDKAMRTFEVIVLLFVIFTCLSVLYQNKRNIDEHRVRNEEVHAEIIGYIKCVLLIPRQPNAPFPEKALDDCAHQSAIRRDKPDR